MRLRSLFLHALLGIAALLCSAVLSDAMATVASNNKAATFAKKPAMNNLRIWRDKEYTRVVLDLDSPVKYSLSQATNPNRIYVDIPNATSNASLAHLALARTPIDLIRSSVVNNNDLRLTLELKQNVSPKSFFLKKEGNSSDRVVIDLFYVAESPAHANKKILANDLQEANGIDSLVKHAPANLKNNSESKNTTDTKTNDEPKINLASKLNIDTKPNIDLGSKREILITVDAGHGGQDTGALGPNGMREKDITLAIAKELAAAINDQPGFKAHLTRGNDIFIPLQERRNIARDKKADLFISIHADAFTNSVAKGASVFALSRKGATSETARFLAQHENESDLIGGVAGVSLDDKDAMLASVLVDFSMTATVNSSLVIGNHVLKTVGTIAPLHAKHVEQAGFVVLKSPDVPSLLIETGFISNKDESRKLSTTEYRTQMAQSIFKGLRQYFMSHPPAGTYIADSQQSGNLNTAGRKHLVVRGDTLSNISARYRVSQRELMKINGLKISSVNLGQTLKIPAQ